jgi:hypothetical protein
VAFTAVGTWHGSSSAALTLANQAIGNLLIVEVINFSNSTVWCTGLTGGGATWVQAGVKFSGTTNNYSAAVFFGTVTATGAQTATPTWSGTAPGSYGIAGQEFHSSVGTWFFDKQGNLDSTGTANWPSLSAVAGQLYFGYAAGLTATSGSTSGYVYNPSVDGVSNGAAYNLSTPSGATFPVWGDIAQQLGIAILVSEGSPAGLMPWRSMPGQTYSRYFHPRREFFPLAPASGSTDATVLASAVSAVTAIPAAVISAGSTVLAAVVNAVTAIPAPVVSAGSAVLAAVVNAVTAIPAPVVSAGSAVLAAVVPAVVTIPAPVISAGSQVSPAVVSAVAAIPAPVISAGSVVQPATVLAVTAIPAPSVSAGGNATATAAVVNAVTAIPAPAVSAGSRVSPPVVTAVTAVGAPAISAGAAVLANTVSASAAIPAPSVTASAVVAPAAVSLITAIPAPVPSGRVLITPAAVALTVTVPAPVIQAGANALAQPPVISITVLIGTPLIGGTPYGTSRIVASAPGGSLIRALLAKIRIRASSGAQAGTAGNAAATSRVTGRET